MKNLRAILCLLAIGGVFSSCQPEGDGLLSDEITSIVNSDTEAILNRDYKILIKQKKSPSWWLTGLTHLVYLPTGYKFSDLDVPSIKYPSLFNVTKIEDLNTVEEDFSLFDDNFSTNIDQLPNAVMWGIKNHGHKYSRMGFAGGFHIDQQVFDCKKSDDYAICQFDVSQYVREVVVDYIKNLGEVSNSKIEEIEDEIADTVKDVIEDALTSIFVGANNQNNGVRLKYKSSHYPVPQVPFEQVVPASKVRCSVHWGKRNETNPIVDLLPGEAVDGVEYDAVIDLNGSNLICSITYKVPGPGVGNPLPTANGVGGLNLADTKEMIKDQNQPVHVLLENIVKDLKRFDDGHKKYLESITK